MKVVNNTTEVGEEPVVNSRYSIVIAAAKRARQLIGTGGVFEAAPNAADAGNRLIHIHAGNQRGNALRVAGATAGENDLGHGAAVHLDIDLTGANARGGISKLFHFFFHSFQFIFPVPLTTARSIP